MLKKHEFEQLSFKSSITKSLRKVKAKDIDDKTISQILDDLAAYNEMMADESKLLILSGISYRIKSLDSVKLKLSRYKDTDRDLRGILNDFLGIRVIVDEYGDLAEYPFLRRVDILDGKVNDDGYRGVHLYYQKDNYHYQIEVQVWSKHDAMFNIWSHMRLYKSDSSDVGRVIRKAYEEGTLKNEVDFDQAFLALREDTEHG